MLRTNLSTRPFYNERLVLLGIAVVALVTAAATIYNVARIVELTRQSAAFSEQAAEREAHAQQLQQQAATIRRGIDRKELEAATAAALEANGLIDLRAFSWTQLFNQIETTLPDDVRVTSAHPEIDRTGAVVVTITVVGRRIDDIQTFMDSLEETGAFTDIGPREEQATDDGMFAAVLTGRYVTQPVANATNVQPKSAGAKR